MKNKHKILIACITVFLMLILSNINNVFAFGSGYTAWRYDVNDDKKPDLVFRRYSTATSEMIESYFKEKSSDYLYDADNKNTYTYTYNGRTYPSKWVYVEPDGVYKPSAYEYSTVGYTIRTDQMKYISAREGDVIAGFHGAYTRNDLTNISFYFDAHDKYGNIYVKPTEDTEENIKNKTIYETYGVNSVITASEWGTGINMSAITPKYKMVYRYAIVQYGDYLVYIEDRVIYHDQLKELRKAIRENKDKIKISEVTKSEKLYISDIVISEAKYDKGGYEVAKTLSQFFTQYKKYGYTDDFWPSSVRGSATDSTKSVLNVFDNFLDLPQTSKKNIIVRHINLGKNNTLSLETVKNAKRYESTDKSIVVRENPDADGKNVYADDETAVDGIIAEEIYLNNIEVYEYIEKASLSEYACMGYNIATDISFEEALKSINNNIMKGKYTEGTTVKLDGLMEESESEYIVIDFYYTEEMEKIYVNHLFIDGNDKILPEAKQSMRGGNLAYIGKYYSESIKAIQPAFNSLEPNEKIVKYIQEQYYRVPGQLIMVSPVTELFDGISYKGYEIFKSYTKFQDLVGYKANINSKWYTPFTITLGVVVPTDKVQINFYYYNRDKTEAAIPKKLPSMEFFISTSKYKGTCYDETNKQVYSAPSGKSTKVGIINIAKVMASAIQLDYVDAGSNTHNVDVVVNYKCGKNTVNMRINNIKYSFGYFRVTELVGDLISQVTLYDASPKWPATSGSNIFNWTDDKTTVNFKTKANIEITGATTIKNNSIDIKNWKNYVSIFVEDKFGNKSEEGVDKVTLEHTYLTVDEMKKVDANGDNHINYEDKTKADDMLAFYKAEYEKVEASNEETIKAYNTAKANREKAYDEYKAALDESTIAKALFTNYKEKYDSIVSRINKINNDISSAKSELSIEEENLIEYQNDLQQKKDDLKYREETLRPNLNAALEKLKERLNAIDTPYAVLVNNYNSLKRELETLEGELNDLNKYLKDLQATETTRKAAVTSAEELVEASCKDAEGNSVESGKCTQAKSNLETAKRNLETTQGLIGETRAKITSKQSEISSKRIAVSSAKAAKENYESISEDIDDKEEEISENEQKISELKSQIQQLENITIPNTKENIAYLKVEIPRLTSLLTPLYRERESSLTNVNKQKEISLAKEAAALSKLAVYHAAMAAEEILKVAYDLAQNSLQKAYNEWQNYVDYRNELYRLYNSYKAKYDEFVELKQYDPGMLATRTQKAMFADYLGMRMTITAYNMHIKINGESLNNPDKLKTSITERLSVVLAGDTVIETPVIEFYTKIYEGVGTKLTEKDYKSYKTDKNIKNGIRTLAGEVRYETNVLIGNSLLTNIGNVEDNVYYSPYVDTKQEITNGTFTLNREGLIGATTKEVNIYTPIFASATLKSDANTIVDQSTSSISKKSNVQTIQLAVPFTITLGNKTSPKDKVYGITNASEFCKGYYIKFNFDVHNVYINDKLYNKGNRVKAGTWIGLINKKSSGETTIKAQVYADVYDNTIDIADEGSGSYVVRAIAYNASTSMIAKSEDYLSVLEMMQYRSELKDIVENICTNTTTTKDTQDLPSYFADTTYEVVVLNRLYDFRVTDVKDVSWKSVFRESQGSVINAHTGNVYYAGKNKWVVGNNGSNTIVQRTASEIGRMPLRILPIGTYKHTDVTYVKAPKLGYGFSYDMKVTGNYYGINGKPLEDKYVDIATKFYYVSDDGKTFLEEYNSKTKQKGIYLFYKNEAGQYVRIDNNGGGYELSFIPNEGYRLIEDKEKTYLSNKSLKLGNLRNIKLTYEMATVDQIYNTDNAANNGTVITYYGEYKLPNSTIAVEVDESGKYDINKPLKNGYIGVIFDITAKAGTYGQDDTPISLSYSENTKSTINTSQWDYEGYLGISKPGASCSTEIKLEGGVWSIGDSLYNKIKGTVIMYDIDERAATDYD